MQSTALIIRPPTAPEIRVLECDGPKHKYVQRGEGSYYLQTNNQPPCDDISLRVDSFFDPRLKDWGEPHWEIYQNHDGSIEIHACRPTAQEIRKGDLHGRWGSVIKIAWPCRPIFRNALRLARRLCQVDPIRGAIISDKDLVGIVVIESEIDVYRWRDSLTAPTRM